MPAAKKILIVDDDRVTCVTLMAMLKAAGYAAISAYDAMSGFSTAMRERPAAVVVDISMPAGGGFSVLERMQTFPALAGTPTIVITASDDAAARERASALGVSAFLLKPVDPEQLRKTVAEVLGTEGAA